MDKIEQEDNKKLHCSVSSHMLLFMVRGMCSTLEYPYAHFATRGITADSLYPIVWEAVQHLESCGMYVIGFCCYGASSNRKFFKMHGLSSDLTYKTPNPFCPNREIFFISDVPHLLKTTHNCLANSFANKHSRALWVSGCTQHKMFNLTSSISPFSEGWKTHQLGASCGTLQSQQDRIRSQP